MTDDIEHAELLRELELLREVRRRVDALAEAATYVYPRPEGQGGAAIRVECPIGPWDALREAIGYDLEGSTPESDGTYLVHLVMDADHRRALCTGEIWGGIPPHLPTGVAMRQCRKCWHAAWRLPAPDASAPNRGETP